MASAAQVLQILKDDLHLTLSIGYLPQPLDGGEDVYLPLRLLHSPIEPLVTCPLEFRGILAHLILRHGTNHHLILAVRQVSKHFFLGAF